MIRALEHITPRTIAKDNREISRIISAAVVNSRFRQKLLQDPLAAVAAGFNGESFNLRSEQQHQMVSANAATLAQFASHFA